MSDYTVYGFANSTYVRTVRMLLEEKGVAYRQVPVNILVGEGQSEEHLARHPFGKIPTFDAGDIHLYETSAIAELIEGRHPQPAFIPAQLEDRARMRQWINVIDAYVYPVVIGRLVWQRVVNPALEQPTDEQIVRDAMPEVRYQLKVLEEALSNRPYLAGEQPSLADLYLAPIMAYVAMTPEAETLFEEFPRLARWWRSMEARKSLQDTPFG